MLGNGKIDEVGRAVQQLGEEMQQDRLARVDAAFDMFQQACRIESSRERNEYVREALNEATRAKALLVRNFAQQQRLVKQGSKKSDAALRAMQDYVAIVNAVNVPDANAYGVGATGRGRVLPSGS